MLSAVKIDHIMNTVGRKSVPKNLREAKKRPDFDTYWRPAMDRESEGFKTREVYRLVDKPDNARALPGKWVFDEKMDPRTCELSAKARWVTCGNYEDSNWSMEDLYAAVANSVSVKTFMALTEVLGWDCYQFDFKTAFLNARIPVGDICYVEQPHGLPKIPRKVWLLLKALYGLRKSPHYWFMEIRPVMLELGFVPFGSDTCLFRQKDDGTLLLLYVDDMLISAPTKAIIHRHASELGKRYKLKELGEAGRFLGLDIVRDRKNRKIYLSQEAFVDKILEKFNYLDLNPVKTPWKPNFELPKIWEPDEAAVKPYMKKTGSLTSIRLEHITNHRQTTSHT